MSKDNSFFVTNANELHKQVRRNFPRRKVITLGIDDLWQADLVEMDTGNIKGISKINNGFKYLLTIIDTFSKFAWAYPIKDKTSSSVVEPFKKLFQKRNPKNLQTDNGKEFYNKEFKELMQKYGVNHYSTFTEKKASIVERFNRTLKEKMWKQFTIRGSHKWIDILNDLIENYNNTKHRTIKMKPIEVNRENEKGLLKKVYSQPNKSIEKFGKYEIGDKVRISKTKKTFEKGYTPNWTKETFTIAEICSTDPITYKLKDYKDEILKGGFYEQEISKSNTKDVYLVEKILKTKGNKCYVKWLGFDDSHNSWVEKSSILDS